MTADLHAAVFTRYVSDGGLGTFSELKHATHAHNLLPLVDDLPLDLPVLEVGPGLGELLECLRAARFQRIEACDVSPEVIEACARRGFPVEPIESIPAFLSTQPSRYGAIFMIDVVEHLSKQSAFEALCAARTALRPDGRLVIQVPNMHSPFASANLYWDITHEVGYTEYSLTQLCHSAGFSSVRLAAYNFPPRGLFRIRAALRAAFYMAVKSVMLIDQWNRASILTPNLIACATKA